MPELNTVIQQSELPTDDEILRLDRLLNGEPEKAELPAEPEKAEPAGDEPPPEKEEATAEEQAEDAKLDYGMKVPITGSEPVTLGELKDLYQNQQAARLELIERENTMLRAVEKSSEMLNYINGLPQHVVQAAQAELASEHHRQAGILNEILPETRTADGIKSVRDALVALGAEYNLQPHDIDQVKHAVTLKMMYDYARLKTQIKEARQNVKPLRSESPKPAQAVINTNATQALIAKAKQSRNVSDEVAAIDALLRSA